MSRSLPCLVFLLFAVAAPARAIEPGDLLSVASLSQNANGGLSVITVDPDSGERVVLSGPTGDGSTVIGGGPGIFLNDGRHAGLAWSGGVIWVSASGGASTSALTRIPGIAQSHPVAQDSGAFLAKRP